MNQKLIEIYLLSEFSKEKKSIIFFEGNRKYLGAKDSYLTNLQT